MSVKYEKNVTYLLAQKHKWHVFSILPEYLGHFDCFILYTNSNDRQECYAKTMIHDKQIINLTFQKKFDKKNNQNNILEL